MMNDYPPLVHGHLYTLTLGDYTRLPLVAWKDTPGMPGQLLDACPGGDLCVHGRHPHLEFRSDGRLQIVDGVEPSRHDPNVRAVAEGLTVDHLRPANRLALAPFRSVAGRCSPCRRCGVSVGQRHHPDCYLNNLVPLWPMFDGEAWRAEFAGDSR